MLLFLPVRAPDGAVSILLALALVGAAGCGPPAMSPPDGGAPMALDVVSPPSAQVGLVYGMSTQLEVRYHADDATKHPVPNAIVRFSIFGDPAGSTLSADQARTDANGLAQVTLTAGQAEAQFRVAATAVNAPEADFDIGVSKLGFVEIDAELAWTRQPAAGTLRALLYDSLSCASLPPSPTVPAQFVRASQRSGSQAASIQFMALLSKDYALVGRAEDVNGALVGYGCVDIPAAVAPPGSISMVPLPLSPAIASPAGTFTVTTMMMPAMALSQPVLAPWQKLGTCPYGAAQYLLDAIRATEQTAAPMIAADIDMARDAPLANGCRPLSTTSLDEKLQALLTAPPTAPANSLPGIVTDLESIVTNLTLKSQLTITTAGRGVYAGEHLLQSATVMAGPSAKTYPLAPFGLPIIDDKDVPITYDGAMLGIGAHGFTLGFAPLWGQALADLSITVRVTGLGTPPIHALVAAIVAAAKHGNVAAGCPSVEDLVCTTIGSPPGCSLQTACASAIDSVAAELGAVFAPPGGIDLSWSGSALASDTTGLLLIDTLSAGAWTSSSLASDNFSGTRSP